MGTTTSFLLCCSCTLVVSILNERPPEEKIPFWLLRISSKVAMSVMACGSSLYSLTSSASSMTGTSFYLWLTRGS